MEWVRTVEEGSEAFTFGIVVVMDDGNKIYFKVWLVDA